MPAREFEQRLATPVGGLILVWLDPADTGKPHQLTERSREALRNIIIHLQELAAVKYDCALPIVTGLIETRKALQPEGSALAADATERALITQISMAEQRAIHFQYEAAYVSNYARILMDLYTGHQPEEIP